MTRPFYLNESAIRSFIETALEEDIGPGDHSTLSTIAPTVQAHARLLCKSDGIIAGVELAGMIFHRIDPTLQLTYFKQDGDAMKIGDIAFEVQGPARGILSGERLVLNCLQRMSAIATLTHRLSQQLIGTSAQLLDTRKTTPNFRLMEKWAVAIGGGMNHRFALYDMIMLKDNHIDVAGGMHAAISKAKKYLTENKLDLRLEVEARTLADVQEALNTASVDVIMLDNMSLADMHTAVQLVAGRCKTEASGGITEKNLRAVAECGVDFISMGALTHSAGSLDLSLKIF